MESDVLSLILPNGVLNSFYHNNKMSKGYQKLSSWQTASEKLAFLANENGLSCCGKNCWIILILALFTFYKMFEQSFERVIIELTFLVRAFLVEF